MPRTIYLVKRTMTGEAIDLRVGPTIILLNAYVVKLPSKYLFIPRDLHCSQPWSRKLLLAMGSNQ